MKFVRGIDEVRGSAHKRGVASVAVRLNKIFGTEYIASKDNKELEQICRDLGVRFTVHGEIITEV